MPTGYSIRNRASTSYVMLCWRLEASNDLMNWVTLDVRNHGLQNQAGIEVLC